jgi:hypothetical protein
LLVGLALKVMRKKAVPPSQAQSQPTGRKEFSEGIGQYRLQLGRGDAD